MKQKQPQIPAITTDSNETKLYFHFHPLALLAAECEPPSKKFPSHFTEWDVDSRKNNSIGNSATMAHHRHDNSVEFSQPKQGAKISTIEKLICH